MKNKIFIILLLTVFSCKSQKENHFASIDFLEIEGKTIDESNFSSFPIYEINNPTINDRILIVWRSKTQKDTYQFKRYKNIWYTIRKEWECEPCEVYYLSILEDNRDITFMYEKVKGKFLIEGITISYNNRIKNYNYKGFEVKPFSEKDYPNPDFLIKINIPKGISNVSFQRKKNQLQEHIYIANIKNKTEEVLVDKTECYEIDGDRFDDKTWWSLISFDKPCK